MDDIKTTLSWESLGDIALGRGNLGEEMPVYLYRLFQFAFKDVLTAKYGADETAAIFRSSGFVGGRAFAEKFLDKTLPVDKFFAQLQAVLKQEKIGIFQVEQADLETLDMTLTVAEDLDCSGLPVAGETVCDYDEGFIAGILTYYTGKDFTVREIDCWATGGRVCRFDVGLKK